MQEKTRKAIERKLEETEAEEREAVAQEKRELFQKIRSEKIRVSRIRSHLDVVEEVCLIRVNSARTDSLVPTV